jgi:hypothetical protein
MAVLGVPDVVVREAVHVDLELPVVVEVHVRNEDNVQRTIRYTINPNQELLNSIQDLEVLQSATPTDYFLFR